VKSSTDIPENLVEHNTQFKLHWMINNTKVDVTNDPRFNVTFVDTDGNGIADRMEYLNKSLKSRRTFKSLTYNLFQQLAVTGRSTLTQQVLQT
jgi:hypothetical protein